MVFSDDFLLFLKIKKKIHLKIHQKLSCGFDQWLWGLEWTDNSDLTAIFVVCSGMWNDTAWNMNILKYKKSYF